MLDIVGYRPQLAVFQKNRYKTILGRILGALSITLILVMCVYVTAITFLRSELSLIFNVSNKDTVLNLSNSPFMIVLTDGLNNPISENLHEIRVNFWNFTKEIDDDYNTLKFYEIPLEPCKIEHFKEHADLFSHIDYQKFKCIPAQKYNISLFGRYGEANPNSFMNVLVNMCNNVTTNNTCPEKSQLEPILKNVYLHMIYIDKELNHYNYDNPIKPYVRAETFPINWDLHSRYFYAFSTLRYFTDYGNIFEHLVEHSSYKFSKNDQNVQIRHGSVAYPGVSIGTVTLYRRNAGDRYDRSYPKIQTLLARVGGSIQAIMVISKAFCYIVTRNLFLIDMININFSKDFLDSDDEKHFQNSKILSGSNNSKIGLSSSIVEKPNVIM
jgi:hypothetical protein